LKRLLAIAGVGSDVPKLARDGRGFRAAFAERKPAIPIGARETRLVVVILEIERDLVLRRIRRTDGDLAAKAFLTSLGDHAGRERRNRPCLAPERERLVDDSEAPASRPLEIRYGALANARGDVRAELPLAAIAVHQSFGAQLVAKSLAGLHEP